MFKPLLSSCSAFYDSVMWFPHNYLNSSYFPIYPPTTHTSVLSYRLSSEFVVRLLEDRQNYTWIYKDIPCLMNTVSTACHNFTHTSTHTHTHTHTILQDKNYLKGTSTEEHKFMCACMCTHVCSKPFLSQYMEKQGS